MIPGPVNKHLERLRNTSGYRINRAPWGWTAYKPGAPSDKDIRAKDLDELEAKIMPPAGDGGAATSRTTPPAGP